MVVEHAVYGLWGRTKWSKITVYACKHMLYNGLIESSVLGTKFVILMSRAATDLQLVRMTWSGIIADWIRKIRVNK